MKKALLWILGVLALVAGLGAAGRWYATGYMHRKAVTPKSLGDATPAAEGIPFSRVAFASGNRTLIGWWVRAPDDSARRAPAVLFFHGNASAISDYATLQKFFHRQGISTLSFDYTGFGASGGMPSLENAVYDAAAAARVFSDSAGPDARKVAFGSALGATVLLQAIDSVQPHVSGVVIEGVAASVRDAAVREGHIPPLVAPLLVDIANNVAAARRVRVPLLAVHSREDNRIPLESAERVVEAVRGRAVLVPHWRPGHSALLTSSRPCDWRPVLEFIRTGVMPAAPVDTVDACATLRDTMVADTVKTDTVKTDTVKAGTVKADTVKADTSTSPAQPSQKK